MARRLRLAQPPLSGSDFRKLVDGQLSEAKWQKQVEEALTVCGWWWMHIPPNVVVCPHCRTKVYRGIQKGFPDLLAIRPPYLLWLELKKEGGRLEEEQVEVGRMLIACGQKWIHARPRDREYVFQLIAYPEKAAW